MFKIDLKVNTKKIILLFLISCLITTLSTYFLQKQHFKYVRKYDLTQLSKVYLSSYSGMPVSLDGDDDFRLYCQSIIDKAKKLVFVLAKDYGEEVILSGVIQGNSRLLFEVKSQDGKLSAMADNLIDKLVTDEVANATAQIRANINKIINRNDKLILLIDKRLDYLRTNNGVVEVDSIINLQEKKTILANENSILGAQLGKEYFVSDVTESMQGPNYFRVLIITFIFYFSLVSLLGLRELVLNFREFK